MSNRHEASDGSIWVIYSACPPVPTRQFDWAAYAEDYDGAPDACDDRVLYGPSRDALIREIERWVEENTPCDHIWNDDAFDRVICEECGVTRGPRYDRD